MSFPEGPLIRKLALVGGPGLEHACPHCGNGITRLDLESANLRLREGIESALRRYDAEDDETLRVRDGLTWAMVSDLREALGESP